MNQRVTPMVKHNFLPHLTVLTHTGLTVAEEHIGPCFQGLIEHRELGEYFESYDEASGHYLLNGS